MFTQNGSVDGALSGRPTMPGKTAVSLDWEKRVAISLSAARGLKDLQAMSLAKGAELVNPSKILLNESMIPQLKPPNPAQLASVDTVSASAILCGLEPCGKH